MPERRLDRPHYILPLNAEESTQKHLSDEITTLRPPVSITESAVEYTSPGSHKPGVRLT
ncbi:hypothetical protein FVEN_g13098 [Fusarium venenatum]|nr:hypothetical protein FVEN_g13098 [Fusarium venenatum]